MVLKSGDRFSEFCEANHLHIATITAPLNETNMYIVWSNESRHAVLIDPSDAGAAIRCIDENRLTLDYILLTHEHYDHIAGLNELRSCLPDAKLIASEKCSKRIQSPKHNLSGVFNLVLAFKQANEPDRDIYVCDVKPYSAEAADMTFFDSMDLMWQGHRISMKEAPGHSPGSILIDIDGQMLFSGDTITYEYELVTGFPGGSKKNYEKITIPIIKKLSRNIKVYPGHGRYFFLEEYFTDKVHC